MSDCDGEGCSTGELSRLIAEAICTEHVSDKVAYLAQDLFPAARLLSVALCVGEGHLAEVSSLLQQGSPKLSLLGPRRSAAALACETSSWLHMLCQQPGPRSRHAWSHPSGFADMSHAAAQQCSSVLFIPIPANPQGVVRRANAKQAVLSIGLANSSHFNSKLLLDGMLLACALADELPLLLWVMRGRLQALATALRHPAAPGRQAQDCCLRHSLLEELPATRGGRRPRQEDLSLEASGQSGAISLQQRLSTGSLPPHALSSVPEEPHSLHGSSRTSSLTEDKLMELCQQQQQQGPACSGGVPLCREARQDRKSLDSEFLLQLERGSRKGRSRPSRGDSARESHDDQLPEKCLPPSLSVSAPGQLENQTDFALTSSLYTLTASDHSEGSSLPPGSPPISDADLPPEEEHLRQHRLSSWGPWGAERSIELGEQQRHCPAAAQRSLAAAAARSSSSQDGSDFFASSQAAHTEWTDMLLEEQQQGLGEQRQGFGSLLPLGDQATACLKADANQTVSSIQSSADAASAIAAGLKQVQPQPDLLAASSPVPTKLAAAAAGLLGNSPQLAVPGAGQQAGASSQLPKTGSKFLGRSPSDIIDTPSWAPTGGRPQQSASLDGFSPGFPSRAERLSSGSPERSHSATSWQLSDAWQQEEVCCTRPSFVEGLLPMRPMWRMSTQYVLGDLGAVTATGALYPVLAAVLPGSAFAMRQWTAATWLLATACCLGLAMAHKWQRHRQTVLVAMLVLMAVASMLGPDTQPILGLQLNYKIDTAWEWLLFQSTVQACASMPVMLRINMLSAAASQAAVWASLLIAAPAKFSAKPVQLDLPGDQLHSLGTYLMPTLAVLAAPTLAFCLKQGW